ncbi:MAG: hypothetical protein BWY99_00387 [Synergistetes bacterium ADurb.BinA166]|nr:MAG: hypothetical protein BWY99_00387 [Synergistetes bacterium ADurb.BinA166]
MNDPKDPKTWKALTGKVAVVMFKDGPGKKALLSRYDEDLGTAAFSWSEGPRQFTCTFPVESVAQVFADPM